jgi:hypothetical protein
VVIILLALQCGQRPRSRGKTPGSCDATVGESSRHVAKCGTSEIRCNIYRVTLSLPNVKTDEERNVSGSLRERDDRERH